MEWVELGEVESARTGEFEPVAEVSNERSGNLAQVSYHFRYTLFSLNYLFGAVQLGVHLLGGCSALSSAQLLGARGSQVKMLNFED